MAAGGDRRGRASGRDVDRQHRRHPSRRLAAEAAAPRLARSAAVPRRLGAPLLRVAGRVRRVAGATGHRRPHAAGAGRGAVRADAGAAAPLRPHRAVCPLDAAGGDLDCRRPAPRSPLAPRGMAGAGRGGRRDSAVPGGDGRADGTGRSGERRPGRGADRASCPHRRGRRRRPRRRHPRRLLAERLLPARRRDQLRPRRRRRLLDEPAVAGDRHRLLRPAAGDSHRQPGPVPRAWSTSAPAGWRWPWPR